MWCGCCEFRGRNRVQRGKYPGFQMDSKEPFVTKPSSCSHGSEMEPKKESGTTPPAVPQTRVASRQERKIATMCRWARASPQATASKPARLLSESPLAGRDVSWLKGDACP